MVFEDNNGGVDGVKDLLHDNNWDVYNSEKKALVNSGSLVEVADKEGKKLIWEVVNDHVVEEAFEHEELGLQVFDCILFDEDREGHTSIDKNY